LTSVCYGFELGLALLNVLKEGRLTDKRARHIQIIVIQLRCRHVEMYDSKYIAL